MAEGWPIPNTAKEALEMWDKNTPFMSLEMSGIGPYPEQCIQIAVMELLRLYTDKKLTDNAVEAIPELESHLTKIDHEKNLQLSGSQWGAIKNLAFHYLTQGYASTINTYGNKRKIMICRKLPS